jgi:RNA polymerase sigma-70 factor (ECF subfamily)
LARQQKPGRTARQDRAPVLATGSLPERDGRTATEQHDPGDTGPRQPLPGPGGGGPAAGQPSDAELLSRHVAGDSDAFSELFLRHRDRLWAVAIRTLADPEEAADALQDAMISAFRRAESFRGDSAVTTWLHRIVVNASLDRLRRRAARPVTSTPDERVLDGLAAGRVLHDPSSDSDVSLDVHAELRRLPYDQQAVLVLVDMLGYPVADTAAILGVSQGTVKSRCARGRARLLPRLAHLNRRASASAPSASASSAGAPAASASSAGAPAAKPDRAERNQTPAGSVLPAQEGGEPR